MKTHTFSSKLTAEALLKDYQAKGMRGYILTLSTNRFEVRVW